MMIKTCKAAPAQIKGRVNVLSCVIHDFAKLVPVINISKFNLLEWGTGNQHTVELLIKELAGRNVKTVQIAFISIFAVMIFHVNKGNLNLKGSVSQKTEKLSFCNFLVRHKINDGNFKRTDVLFKSPLFGHDEDILFFKY